MGGVVEGEHESMEFSMRTRFDSTPIQPGVRAHLLYLPELPGARYAPSRALSLSPAGNNQRSAQGCAFILPVLSPFPFDGKKSEKTKQKKRACRVSYAASLGGATRISTFGRRRCRCPGTGDVLSNHHCLGLSSDFDHGPPPSMASI